MAGIFASELWRQNPEDYIIIANELVYADGITRVGYLIVDAKKQISHIIESQSDVRPIVAKMIEAGVRVVNMEEALKILHG